MAQPGNDNQKTGVSTDGPSNVMQGVQSGGDNFTATSMATRADGDPMDRGQTAYSTKWLYPDKPGIE